MSLPEAAAAAVEPITFTNSRALIEFLHKLMWLQTDDTIDICKHRTSYGRTASGSFFQPFVIGSDTYCFYARKVDESVKQMTADHIDALVCASPNAVAAAAYAPAPSTKYISLGLTPGSTADERQELERLHKLIHLCAHEIVFFSSYNEDKDEHDEGAYAAVIVNDTFAYGCSDCENLPPDQLALLFDTYRQFDYAGVVAWASLRRGGRQPISEYRTQAYDDARQYLADKVAVA